MSVRVHKSERSRHLVLRISAGEAIPGALVSALGDEHVAAGWLRASGVLADVELCAFDATLGRLGEPRRIAGTVQVLSLESSIGLSGGEPALSLRAVLARESDRGLETLAGEIVSARAVALEALVTVLEDLALDRTLDPRVGVALVDSAAVAGASPPAVEARAPQAPPRAAAAASTSWSSAATASAQSDTSPGAARAGTSPQGSGMAAPIPLPQRPGRIEVQVDQPTPEPGDVVDHFAFGRCEVIKSDGDRLHLRVPKDGRIREIALEMLRVTPLENEGTVRRFKLERRI